ncbi:hypothetical protein [Streptomyces sp. NPDC088794]|uniref:hypothetical protein n=1 Tax=Streptomyces sp. NPDC088794 TaxID=3365902 RepID=UPI00381D32A4
MNSTVPDAGPLDAAGVARVVGTALEQHAAADVGPDDAAEARDITDAMVRLLIGAPLRRQADHCLPRR